jgi:REP-associated tyrosine transposase
VAYKHRDQTPGPHHVVTRGNNKRSIYKDDGDREHFCLLVDEVARRYGWRILAFALMRNHYHLIVVIGEKGLADGMCELNTGYARGYNQRHGRVNHLFGKRYFNRRLRTDASVVTAVRYVVQNPRRAGGSKPLEGYAWTSFAATVGLAAAKMSTLDIPGALAYFGSTAARALEEFRVFCNARPLGPTRWQPP